MPEKNKLYDAYAKFQNKMNKNIITFGFLAFATLFQ